MLFLLTALSLSRVSIIPRPLELTELEGRSWSLLEGMQVGYDSSIKDYASDLAKFISDSLFTPTGIRLSVAESSSVKLGIQLTSSTDDEYHLTMDENLVKIAAKDRELLFDGFQTLLQLLPPEIYINKTVQEKVNWVAPCVVVHDKPRFQWRGLMVDVCRHFFDVDVIKSIIDGMSHFKLNTLHFHLTEDQGWRIDLKKYPDLAKFGSKRDASPKPWTGGSQLDGIPYGPFSFSEEEVKEIIDYAAQRSIRVIPEIEMPGHALGLLCGYPQYSCTGGPFKPRCYWGVEPDIICAGNDEALAFLESILDEILKIFPSVYIHCGGDECPRTRWQTCPKCQKRMKDEGLQNEDQLQSWFTHHFATYLESKGRRLIGWDEILRGGLEFPQSAVVMSWLGNAAKAAELGHDVVMSPNGRLYLDYQQFLAKEPYEYIGGFITTYSIYNYNPTSGIAEDLQHHIIGCQGNLWSEYIWERADLQWKAFPRALAISEVGWVPDADKDWVRFMRDYTARGKPILANMGIHEAGLQYGNLGAWNKGDLTADKWISIEFPVDQALNKNGNIEAAFVYKDGSANCKVRNVKLLFNDAVAASDDHEGIIGEEPQNSLYGLKTQAEATPDNIKIQAEMMCQGSDDCEGVIYLYIK